jgi:hypothetical protein
VSVVIIVADGARPDTLSSAMEAGHLPALARLRSDGALHTVTTVFPSVTGPAYTPFLLGRFPGPIGLPGLRWYDRTRRTARFGNARSYVGFEMGKIDADIDADAPTLFELASSGLGALNVINRGLPRRARIGQRLSFAARAGVTHFRGNVRGWLAIDRDVARETARRIHLDRPDVVFAALTGIDKTSHAAGHESELVREAMRIVDDLVADVRQNAERAGYWDEMHLWVVSDHGHSPVRRHEDLAGLLRSWELRPVAHPWLFVRRPLTAVMVSGNAMAHIYLDIEGRDRHGWEHLGARWNPIARALLDRQSVDLLLLPHSARRCEVWTRTRGHALLDWTSEDPERGRYSYLPQTGDPLGVGELENLDRNAAHDATIDSDYPDSLVQIVGVASAARSGDIILSAARDWDFRAKYEPIPHVSSHGALHREHMLVPLVLNRAPAKAPRRTTDIMPSALKALGLPIPSGLDGESFL